MVHLYGALYPNDPARPYSLVHEWMHNIPLLVGDNAISNQSSITPVELDAQHFEL